jgi:8-oxo-dGTP pyrophosphatase MutT (NUDIX family)
MTNAQHREIRAAGAVVWRDGPEGRRIALVHRPKYDDWSLPKGKTEPGEHVLLTAVREVAEEAGARITLGRRLPTTAYTVDGRPKRVDYWAGRSVSPDAFTPGTEVDAMAWLPLAEAAGRLSYRRDVRVLDAFAAGPADTVPVILLRHADAISRKAWRKSGHGDDLARPLSAKGQADAQALGQILGTLTPRRVISSGAERCLATVRPYAALAGAVVETEPELTIGGSTAEPGPAWAASEEASKRIAAVVAAGEPVAICAHRQNMSWLLAQACAVLDAPVPDGPRLRKGAFWVLQAGEDRLASAEQHQPEPDG